MDGERKPTGTGRGAHLLEMLKQSQKTEPRRSDLASDSPDISSVTSISQRRYEEQSSLSELQSSFNSSTSLGRGTRMASLLQSLNTTSESQRSESDTPRIGQGRGYLLKLAQTHSSAQSTASGGESIIDVRQDCAGVLGKLSDLSVYDNPSTSDIEEPPENKSPICRQGKSGTEIELFSNYIDLKFEPGKGLFQYEVKYIPDIDSRSLRRRLLNQHSAKLGRTKIFDGVLLYLPVKLPENITCYDSEHPMDGSKIVLKIIYKKKQQMSENTQFFNILLGRIMRALNLVRIGRQNFNPKAAHAITQHHLEVWPGYVTAINEYEGGLKLCLDAKHRVMRTETIRDLITGLYQDRRANYKDNVVSEIVGTSVLTRYNNKTYRIDDIDWDKTPEFTFSKDGAKISLIDYYKTHWSIEIQDKKQPLLVHRAVQRTSSGEKQERLCLLVPELCYASGLTDNIRNNFKIMKDLGNVTRMSPENRRIGIKRFIEQVEKTEVTREIFSEWGLHMSKDIVQFRGRYLEPEVIHFGNKDYHPTEKIGDWGSVATKSRVLYTPHLKSWHIIYCKRDSNCVQSFLTMLQNITKVIGMNVSQPRITTLKDDRTESYVQELQSSINDVLELIVIVFPTNRTDRYSAVKRLCCVQRPIASQVIISKTISNPAKLKSITEKIALQINCKLGGALWSVSMPLKNCMICGIDVFHSGTGGVVKKSVAGFIASLDAQMTKWHSRICIQANRQELVDMLQICLTSAVNAYYKHNRCNPSRIIIYRDGVGDGDLDYVERYEVKQLLETFNRIEPDYKPQLSVIIVQKRINTRLFAKGRRGLENPIAGTVVDSCITRRNYYDFFLVPQSIQQGSVTPTHYIVIHDSSSLETDHMQRLTYKLCHLYYNWPGTIRVPAPCQYAHKLVYLIGQNIQTNPHESLSNTLFYL